MSEETNTETKAESAQEQDMSPEDFKKLRDEAIDGIEMEIPYLEAQLKYETLVANIEEQRVKKLLMIGRQAQMMQGPGEEPEPSQNPMPEGPPPPMPPSMQQTPGRQLKQD